MRLKFEDVTLTLKHPFRLHGGTKKSAQVLICEIEHDGITGVGEACPSKYYGETPESVKAVWNAIDFSVHRDPFLYEAIYNALREQFPRDTAARAGVDIALFDWLGKKMNVPLYRFFELDKSHIPASSFTIGFASTDELVRKIHEAEDFPILKIKLGTTNDRTIIETIRSVTDKPIRVDANEGWSREEALEKIKWLEDKNVQFVEQPLKKEDLDGHAWLKERVALPLFADESARAPEDIHKIHAAFDGVVVKIMKAGGIQAAIEAIRLARSYGLQTMLSCFLETSVAISAAAHISPLVDYADLDGHLLITDDPFEGLSLVDGRVMVSEEPGLGIRRKNRDDDYGA